MKKWTKPVSLSAVFLPAPLWTALFISIFVSLFVPAVSRAAGATDSEEKSSSMQMMERIERIVYGEPSKGGLIERLNSIEKELFGRNLPGSISVRHTGVLNFLETGAADQPSMLFKLGVAEWIVGNVQTREPALKRVETLETDIDGEMQYGKPLAMRVERLLAVLVADPVTAQEVTLPGASVLKVKFLEELSPAKSKKGDSVGLALVDDLFTGSVLVAPKGSLVDASVRQVKKPAVFGIPGEVQLEFKTLLPLGSQRVPVTVGAASKKATEEAQKGRDRGEGAIIGAGAASIGGAVLLGPVGLLGGLLVRGNSVKIPEGTVMFLETSGDARVSGYPVPESLRADPNRAIRESVGTGSPPNTTGGGTIELPTEQKIN